ncbi:MAG TPA: HEAT repeat domain-containing protein [Tepidiformaceae bacterium]|nr:HEAT repeat domain-containing protein [Tepidiformaceae bacterium]
MDATVQSLIRALGGREELPAWRARRALEAIGPAAVPELIEALHHGPPEVRWEAAKALGTIADPGSADALIAALQDDDGGVRWLAAEALREIGRPSVPPLLMALVSHSESPWLREGAYHALRSLAADELAPILTPVVQSMHGIAPAIGVMSAADQALAELDALPNVPSSAPQAWRATRGPRLHPAHGQWRNLALRL